MGAAITEVVVRGGMRALHCPATGRIVFDDGGFRGDEPHSPHLRFFVDWAGGVWVAKAESVPPHHRDYLTAIAAVWRDPGDANQNERVKECLAILPPSAIVLEVLTPTEGGGSGGEICYACFDLDGSSKEMVELEAVFG